MFSRSPYLIGINPSSLTTEKSRMALGYLNKNWVGNKTSVTKPQPLKEVDGLGGGGLGVFLSLFFLGGGNAICN